MLKPITCVATDQEIVNEFIKGSTIKDVANKYNTNYSYLKKVITRYPNDDFYFYMKDRYRYEDYESYLKRKELDLKKKSVINLFNKGYTMDEISVIRNIHKDDVEEIIYSDCFETKNIENYKKYLDQRKFQYGDFSKEKYIVRFEQYLREEYFEEVGSELEGAMSSMMWYYSKLKELYIKYNKEIPIHFMDLADMINNK